MNQIKKPMNRLRKQANLSKTQSKRLGGLIQVLGNSKPLDDIISNLESLKMVVQKDDCLMVTEKGLDETNRLSTLAGLYESKKK